MIFYPKTFLPHMAAFLSGFLFWNVDLTPKDRFPEKEKTYIFTQILWAGTLNSSWRPFQTLRKLPGSTESHTCFHKPQQFYALG